MECEIGESTPVGSVLDTFDIVDWFVVVCLIAVTAISVLIVLGFYG